MMDWLRNLFPGYRGDGGDGDGREDGRGEEGGDMDDSQKAVRAAQDRRREQERLASEMVRRMKTVDAQIESKLGRKHT